MTFSKEETRTFFHDALCNNYYENLVPRIGKEAYRIAKEALLSKGEAGGMRREDILLCREDVWMEHFDSTGTFTMLDTEEDEEYTVTWDEAIERLGGLPRHHIANLLTENADAETSDAVIQQIMLGEIVYG